jgi:hypothetical protein
MADGPVGPLPASARLDTSNGCQDHTLLPYASAPFVLRALIAHETALRSVHAPDAACVHRIPPRVRDDRDTPLSVGRDGMVYSADSHF